ncbi:MAG: hypothetical protein AAGF23_27655, partial [Acidobacteriota bacterium]
LRRQHLEADRRYLGGWLPGLEPDAAAQELERFNDVLRAADSTRRLDAARDLPWTDADFGDAMHFSAAGSAKLSRYVADALVADVRTACAADRRSSRRSSPPAT